MKLIFAPTPKIIRHHFNAHIMTKNCFSLPVLLLIAFSTLTLIACGEDCDFDQEDYVGTYKVTEACSLTSATAYNVSISAGATESEVKITNFWDIFNNPVYATLNCETITIAHQEPDGDKYFVEGSGVIQKNNGNITIKWTYTITDESVSSNILSDHCTATIYTKQ